MIIDLIAIISFVLPLNLTHLRFIRIIKLFSIFRSRKYKNAILTISRVLHNQKDAIVAIGVIFFTLILFSSSLMCLVEGPFQVGFSSIAKCLWWSIITCTTVGYGDLVPITFSGKVIASITALLGFLLYSMLTAVFSSGFVRELKKISKIKKKKEF